MPLALAQELCDRLRCALLCAGAYAPSRSCCARRLESCRICARGRYRPSICSSPRRHRRPPRKARRPTSVETPENEIAEIAAMRPNLNLFLRSRLWGSAHGTWGDSKRVTSRCYSQPDNLRFQLLAVPQRQLRVWQPSPGLRSRVISIRYGPWLRDLSLSDLC